jgi:hypothetical protein
MNEQEARKVFSHAIAMHKVFGGDIRQMCAQRGVPDELVSKLLAEQAFWDQGLGKFDWDGSVKPGHSHAERRREARADVSIPATFSLENRLYACVVQNISTGGLLLKFAQQPELLLSKDDTGKSGTVVLDADGQSRKTLQGKIVRVLVIDTAPGAALSVIR